MPTINEIIGKYITLRDKKAEIAKRQAEEIEPLSKAMDAIETWLMGQLNELGIDNVKSEFGTAYRTTTNSVKLTDAGAFKGHVFAPAAEAIAEITGVESATVLSYLQTMPRWDMVDFRAGKKGVVEYLDTTKELPPGVEVQTTAVVNVRRA